MTKLSVNVNKLATLRNARGKNNPDVLKTTLDIVAFGAQGITVHPRPDERHIRRDDVYAIAKAIDVEFNIEGYPDQRYLDLVLEVNPAQATLVPDPPDVLTSNAGWQVAKNKDFLRDVIAELHQSNIRVSLFIDPFQCTKADLAALAETKTDRVELYTEAYADAYGTERFKEVLDVYVAVAAAINSLGIELNAGHDLDTDNLKPLLQAIPSIKEVSIGHALICDALTFGMKDTIKKYLACL